MKPESGDEARRKIAERAAHWLLTLQTEEATKTRRTEFVDWLCASPLHIAEFLRISQLQRGLSAFQGWSQLSAFDSPDQENVLQLQGVSVTAAEPRGFPGRGRRLALLAAGLAAVCATGMLVFTRLHQTTYRTVAGERREVTLSDGSVVELAPESDVAVQYSASDRLVTLGHGNAQFRVAKNPNRPFIVQAARTRVRAVGTVFNVDRGEQGVSVRVVEGRVAVSQQPLAASARNVSETAAPMLSLQANEQVLISAAGIVYGVQQVDKNSWVASGTDELVFDNETVGDVVRRFNLGNRTQIEVLDARLAARRISGVFRSSDPQSFVSFVQAAASVRVTRPDELHIRLSSRPGDGRDAAH